MKGAYCLLLHLDEETRIDVGALGARTFPPGVYVYVGSAQGGIEKRLSRHLSEKRSTHWHIDHLLDHARVLSAISLNVSRKEDECEVARSLLTCEDSEVVVEGFGSSDCSCRSHLIHFTSDDYDNIAEMISMRLCMLPAVYPKSSGG